MSSMTIISGPRYGTEATDKYPGLNPCRFHGIQPKVVEEEKRKGSRHVKTGYLIACCPECEKTDPERTVYSYGGIAEKWNYYNPTFKTEDDRKFSNVNVLHKEIASYVTERDQAQKEADRLSSIIAKKMDIVSELLGVEKLADIKLK